MKLKALVRYLITLAIVTCSVGGAVHLLSRFATNVLVGLPLFAVSLPLAIVSIYFYCTSDTSERL